VPGTAAGFVAVADAFAVNVACQMVPAPHSELAWKWPVARLEQALSGNGSFLFHSGEEGAHWWNGACTDVVEVSATEPTGLPFCSWYFCICR